MCPYSKKNCYFQRFLLFRNKARNAGRSDENAGNKQKCGISRTIAGRLTPMALPVSCELTSVVHDDDAQENAEYQNEGTEYPAHS